MVTVRWLLGGVLALSLLGCQSGPDRAMLRALPDDAAPQPYRELLLRARELAMDATRASHVDNWTLLHDDARSLEQTAKFLARASDLTDLQKPTVLKQSSELAEQARQLSQAAEKKDIKQTTELLKQIHLKVRDLQLP